MNAAPRDASLDAMRGLAVLGMVLSGSVAFGGVLPGWMFHAQVPPPLHRFEPARAGISWVDLVFPFFLFAMGAALPLALRRLDGTGAALRTIGQRFARLLFFALFTEQMKPAQLAGLPAWAASCMALVAFVLLGLMLAPAPRWLKAAAWGTGLALLAAQPFAAPGASWARSDIILLVLADMALFGGLLCWFSRGRAWVRLAVLPLLAALLLGRGVAGSWNAALAGFTPAGWAYQFYFLKYLFILVPGMCFGEWLLSASPEPARPPRALAAVALAVIVVNVWLLYVREPTLDLLASGALLALARLPRPVSVLDRRCLDAGSYLVVLGLALEALEGGIRKDSSTFSYYALSSGLAFFMLLALRASGGRWRDALAALGRNPLLAYVAGSLVVAPLLHLAGLYRFWSALGANAAEGLLKGVVFTGAVALLTLACSRKGWIWKS